MAVQVYIYVWQENKTNYILSVKSFSVVVLSPMLIWLRDLAIIIKKNRLNLWVIRSIFSAINLLQLIWFNSFLELTNLRVEHFLEHIYILNDTSLLLFVAYMIGYIMRELIKQKNCWLQTCSLIPIFIQITIVYTCSLINLVNIIMLHKLLLDRFTLVGKASRIYIIG